MGKPVEVEQTPRCGSRGPSQEIFRLESGWHFWDDNRCFYHGPYRSYEDARRAVKEYVININGGFDVQE